MPGLTPGVGTGVGGGIAYLGTCNAATNTPTLSDGSGTVSGQYYIVGTGGFTSLDGITDWIAGDWVIFSGAVWQKIDNTDLVASVAGKTGVVTLEASDLTDINTSTPTNRFALIADGIDFESRLLIEADISDLAAYATQLSELSDVNTSTVTNRFVLVADGVDFESRLLVEADISDLGSYVTALTAPAEIMLDVGDETTALTTGTAKKTFRMPYAMTVTEVRASVTTAPTDATLNVDINEGGTTILSTVITIDSTEKTSETAATPPVISDSALADDAEMTIDIDQVGSTIAGAGLKVTLIGTRA
jgi:hypothetical protein